MNGAKLTNRHVRRDQGRSPVALRRIVNRFSAPPDHRVPPPHITGGAVDLQFSTSEGVPLDAFQESQQNRLIDRKFEREGAAESHVVLGHAAPQCWSNDDRRIFCRPAHPPVPVRQQQDDLLGQIQLSKLAKGACGVRTIRQPARDSVRSIELSWSAAA